MLRSFDYAAAATLTEEVAVRPEQRALVESMAQDWRRRAKQAFLDGYMQAIEGCPSFPSDPATAAALIDLFTLEKALYEVEYEASNRPGWIPIAVSGVLELIGSATLVEEPA
jgi:maltose alpha-D-glucosyltransferase/alpha-amylase